MRPLQLLLLGMGGCLMVGQPNLAPNLVQRCLPTETGDSRAFGDAIAVNERYIAIGDPEANRVVLYGRSAEDSWSRIEEIYPPPGSAAEAVGAGFGYDLALDGDRLVVGAYLETRRPTDPEAFQWTNQLGTAYSGGVYQVALNDGSGEASVVERLDTVSNDEISGFSVSAAAGTVAFSTRALQDTGVGEGQVELRGDRISAQILPPTPEAAQSFGIDIALSEHRLLVGAPFDETGSAWLFDLMNLEDSPQRLAADNVHVGSQVAISNQFAAVSSLSARSARASATPAKTLLLSLADNTIIPLDSTGKLSLNNRLLAQFQSIEGEQSTGLTLFDLTQLNASQTSSPVIETREGVYQAQLSPQTLVTVHQQNENRQLCIEPLGE